MPKLVVEVVSAYFLLATGLDRCSIELVELRGLLCCMRHSLQQSRRMQHPLRLALCRGATEDFGAILVSLLRCEDQVNDVASFFWQSQGLQQQELLQGTVLHL